MYSPSFAIALTLAMLAAACGAASATSPASVPPQQGASNGKARIDLQVTNVPIVDALRELAERAHINLDVAGSHLTGTVTIDVRAKPWDEVLAMIASDHHLRVTVTGSVVRVSDASEPPPQVQSYTGAPIEASFDETPIRAAVKTIADLSGTKITVDDDVNVAVTLHLRNVPWDLALDHLVRKYGLRVVREAESLRIAKP